MSNALVTARLTCQASQLLRLLPGVGDPCGVWPTSTSADAPAGLIAHVRMGQAWLRPQGAGCMICWMPDPAHLMPLDVLRRLEILVVRMATKSCVVPGAGGTAPYMPRIGHTQLTRRGIPWPGKTWLGCSACRHEP